MSGVLPLLPLYAFIACTGAALPLNEVFFPKATFPVFTSHLLSMSARISHLLFAVGEVWCRVQERIHR